MRLHGKSAFAAVYAAKTRSASGPLVLYSRPNDLPHCRLGLSVSRSVGIAVTRNRIKRLIRESFRLSHPNLPAGYDLIVVVRPHKPLELSEYQKLLRKLAANLHRTWQSGRPENNPAKP
jgi:ribonuclease P protein component